MSGDGQEWRASGCALGPEAPIGLDSLGYPARVGLRLWGLAGGWLAPPAPYLPAWCGPAVASWLHA